MSLLRVWSLGLALLFAGVVVLQPVTVHAEAKVRAKKKAKPKAKAKKKKKKKTAPAESQYKIRVEEAPSVYKFDAQGDPILPKSKKKPVEPKKTSAPDEIDGIAPLDDARSCAEGAACSASPSTAP